jgi:hypothetical protein
MNLTTRTLLASLPLHFRVTQDVKISGDRAFIKSLGGGKTVAIKGALKYQALDDKICYFSEVCRQAGKCRCCPWPRPGAGSDAAQGVRRGPFFPFP